MALPSKLKNLNLFDSGLSYLGLVPSVALPKLARIMLEYRGGGMDGSVKADMGQQPLDFEWVAGGIIATALSQYGAASVDAVQLRFAGAYQRDDTGAVDAVEVVVRGRHEEIDFGDGKVGDDTEHKFKTACSYYKLSINGAVKIEIDLLGMVFIVDGVDRLAEMRAALGI